MAKKSKRRKKIRGRSAGYVTHINNRINSALNRDKVVRGRHNEKYALKLTLELYRSGKLPETAETPYLTRPKSKLDRAGIDLVIPTDKGLVGIQIKSSHIQMKKFLAREKEQQLRRVPCIVVNEKKSDAEIIIRLLGCIWKEYRAMG